MTGDNKGQHSYFYVDFSEFFKSEDSDDLIKVFYEKIEDEMSFRKMLFPFYDLEYHNNWVNGLEDFLRKQEDLDEQKIRDLRRLIDDKLRYIYKDFEIPYVTLGEDRSLEQVTEIFEKINSSGIQLNVFDLLIARLNKYDIKLRDLWEESRSHPNEMRVVVDPKIYREYHDRWLLSSNINYNLMSGDVAKRGQYAEIKRTENRPPFLEWWQNSLDIISCWNDINRYRESLKE